MTGEQNLSLQVVIRVAPVMEVLPGMTPIMVTIFDLSGRITLGDGSMALRDCVRDALDAGARRIVLNLAEVERVDSSGVAEIISAWAAAKDRDGELKLLAPHWHVRQMMESIRLKNVMGIFEDEQAALLSFAQVQ